MIPAELSWPIRCPHCESSMVIYREHSTGDRVTAIACNAGHTFDAAKQGYVNLNVGSGSKFKPDTTEMILARERVQKAGIFDVLSQHLMSTIGAHLAPNDCIADIGTGTGHYLHELLDHFPETKGIGFDLSVPGVKRAVQHERAFALVSDVWQPLPLQSDSIAVVLNVFAPRNVEEFHRILRPGGRLVTVTPRPGHLTELQELGLLGLQESKHEVLQENMTALFGSSITHDVVQATVPVDDDDVVDTIYMGPAGHHREAQQLRSTIAEADIWEITIELDVTVWEKLSTGDIDAPVTF